MKNNKFINGMLKTFDPSSENYKLFLAIKRITIPQEVRKLIKNTFKKQDEIDWVEYCYVIWRNKEYGFGVKKDAKGKLETYTLFEDDKKSDLKQYIFYYIYKFNK